MSSLKALRSLVESPTHCLGLRGAPIPIREEDYPPCEALMINEDPEMVLSAALLLGEIALSEVKHTGVQQDSPTKREDLGDKVFNMLPVSVL